MTRPLPQPSVLSGVDVIVYYFIDEKMDNGTGSHSLKVKEKEPPWIRIHVL